MKVIPSADLGLMAEHLAAHEGVISKLSLYEEKVNYSSVRALIKLHKDMLQVHVDVMLALINPYHEPYVHVPSLPKIEDTYHFQGNINDEAIPDVKWIVLEAHNTAKSMSNRNYVSALMMKDPNVRHAHIKMAKQDLRIMKQHEDIMAKMGWSFTPKASVQEQITTVQQFQHILDNK